MAITLYTMGLSLVVVELDEMWHYLHSKNKLWIWKAYRRATGQLIDWECGARLNVGMSGFISQTIGKFTRKR